MALIPYAQLAGPNQPPLLIGTDPVQELYCGDFRCDCVTGHLVHHNTRFVVDLGTGRVDFANPQLAPGREELATQVGRLVRSPEVLEKMRAHYAAIREFGKLNHFLFMDWTQLKPGAVIPWHEIERHTQPVSFRVVIKSQPGAQSPETAEGPAQDEQAGATVPIVFDDAYCVDKSCECNRVALQVIAPSRKGMESAGVVLYSFHSKLPAVASHAPAVDPNELFRLVQGVMKDQPKLVEEYQSRYHFAREHLIPLIRMQRERVVRARASAQVGRNDNCPCGSGKKFKKCHGK